MRCLPTRLGSFPTPIMDLGPRICPIRQDPRAIVRLLQNTRRAARSLSPDVEQAVTFCLDPPRHSLFPLLFSPLTSSRHTTRSLAGCLTLFSPDTTAPRPPALEQPLSPRRVPPLLVSHSGQCHARLWSLRPCPPPSSGFVSLLSVRCATDRVYERAS